MRTAESILNIIRERGQRGLPLERVYRLLFQRDLYLRAYGKLYANEGAMTEGVTEETVDGMSLAKIDIIIRDLRSERYRWIPVRRTYIPKKNGKLRPLGMPTWKDKLLQEVIRSILEAFQFAFARFPTGPGMSYGLTGGSLLWDWNEVVYRRGYLRLL
jgi:retron-type reverse transcriptase